MLPTMAAAGAALYLAPRFLPAAAIRPAAVAFAAGIAILVGGLVLRGWSIMTLGDYFTGRVMVSADQPVITAGPYRVLRHPSYTGFLLACAGLGLAAANWAGLAIMVLLPLAVMLLAHPGRGERPAGHARRPVRLLRRAAQAPRPVRLVIRPAQAISLAVPTGRHSPGQRRPARPAPGSRRSRRRSGCSSRGRWGAAAVRTRSLRPE